MSRRTGASRASALDAIVSRTAADPPPMVRTLRMPGLDGWEPGRVWVEWKVDPDMFHGAGAVFGGYIGALADGMLSLAAFSTLSDDEVFTTSDLRVAFFRPITGGVVRIEARVLNRGRRMAHVEATFTLEDGKLAAKATATEVIMPARDAG